MTIDIERYSINRKFIQDWYLVKGVDDPKRAIALLASMTSVPCIVVAYYIGEVSAWRPEVVQSIQTFIDFYGYTKIENKPEGAPI